jgi:hypothetical protein
MVVHPYSSRHSSTLIRLTTSRTPRPSCRATLPWGAKRGSRSKSRSEPLDIEAYGNGEQCHAEEHEQTCLAYRGCGGERAEAVGLLHVHSLDFPCEIPDTQETGGGSKATSRHEGSCTDLRHNRRFQERILDSLDSLDSQDSFVRLLFPQNNSSRSLAGEELFLPIGPTS